MIVSIHQPNFMPWYPYFQKMREVDRFVILSHCQFGKNGYTNRFMINDKWHTMSVRKGMLPISEKKYANPHADWSRIKESLPEYNNVLCEFDSCITESLESTNISIITKVAKMLDIKTDIVFDYPTMLKSTSRLVDICQKHEAKKYLSGAGGKEYIDVNLFQAKDIDVAFQECTDKRHILEVLRCEG